MHHRLNAELGERAPHLRVVTDTPHPLAELAPGARATAHAAHGRARHRRALRERGERSRRELRAARKRHRVRVRRHLLERGRRRSRPDSRLGLRHRWARVPPHQ
jgi:hypothetical protein